MTYGFLTAFMQVPLLEDLMEHLVLPFLNTQTNLVYFKKNASKQIAEVQKTQGLRVTDDARRYDVIHYTTLPWFSFTSFRHEKNFNYKESIPKIAFGKFFTHEDKKWLPLSVNANHGLIDGYHVSKYLELFQTGLNKTL